MGNDQTLWVIEHANGFQSVLSRHSTLTIDQVRECCPNAKLVPYAPKRQPVYPQWVSVHDELPPMDDHLSVLVFTADSMINGAQFFDVPVRDMYLKENDPFIRAITHWSLKPYPGRDV